MTFKKLRKKVEVERKQRLNNLQSAVESAKEELKQIDEEQLAATVAEDSAKEAESSEAYNKAKLELDNAKRELELYERAYNDLIEKDIEEAMPWINEQIIEYNTIANHWQKEIQKNEFAIEEMKNNRQKKLEEIDRMRLYVFNLSRKIGSRVNNKLASINYQVTDENIDHYKTDSKYLKKLETEPEYKTKYKIELR